MTKSYERPNLKGTQQLNLRIEAHLVEFLKELAAANDRPVGRQLSVLLKQEMARQERAHAAAERADYDQNAAAIDAAGPSDGAEFGPVEDTPAKGKR